MRGKITFLLLSAGALALSGCSKENMAGRAFYAEAGSEIETNNFGGATRNNVGVHTGSISQLVNMTNKFAADVPNTVNFAFDKADLDAEARAALVRQADWIKQFPEIRFRVYGHTDLVGSDGYNKRLGLRRANAVVNFLVSQGISRSRLEAVVSYGKTQPLVAVQSPERRNRRTVTEVSGFVDTNPLLLNGKYAQVIFRDYVSSAVPPHTAGGRSEVSAPGSDGSGG